MSTYRWADTYDQTLGSLTVLTPQPRSPGVQVTRRVFYADGTISDQGLWVPLIWDMFETETAYQSMLTTLGINSATTNQGTLYARSPTFAWTRYNGIAVQPEVGRDGAWDNYFLRGVTVIVKALEVAS